jgi:tetratricopeptide (TPR) repeat protein
MISKAHACAENHAKSSSASPSCHLWSAVCGIMGWLFLGVFATPVASQTLSRQQQLTLLEQANHAFEQALSSRKGHEAQGHYQQAIEAYEQLVAAGVHNAKLYYDLGNAYFLRDDLGRAILYYRRGLRLEPGNRRLQANLRYALSQRIDQFDASTQQDLVPRLLFWHDDLSPRTQVTLAVLGFGLVWVGACVRLFWRRSSLLWFMTGAALVFLLFTSSALVVHAQQTTVRHGVIVAPEARVRKGNGESYALQFPQPLHPGAEFVILEERGAWLYIRLENGASGWIRRERAALW